MKNDKATFQEMQQCLIALDMFEETYNKKPYKHTPPSQIVVLWSNANDWSYMFFWIYFQKVLTFLKFLDKIY